MFFNEKQLLALNATKMSKIIFKEMFIKNHQLGYTDRGDQYGYHINIASDAPNEDVKNITLLHEAGHIYLHHIDENIKEELNNIEALLKSSKKSFKDLKKYYGGPLNFLNICMDLEVNSKILTKTNIDLMEEFFPLCTPEKYNVPIFDKFFEYYEPLIRRMKDSIDEPDDNQNGDNSEENNSNLNPGENSENNDPNNSSPGNNENDESNANENDSSNNEKNESNENDNLKDSEENKQKGDEKDSPEENNQKEKEEKQNNDSSEKSKNKYSGGLNDIPNFDINWDDVSNDLQNALKDENYSLYDEKDNYNISNEMPAIKYLFSIGAGTNHNESKEEDIEIVENNNKNIEKFLRNILGDNMIIRQDAMRHYNRGTRDRSNNILYNSLRRRVEFDRKRLGIIIDVSGSMDVSSLTMALSSLQNCYQLLDQESEIFTWDTNLIQNFKINKIPKKIISGGGTELSSALRYVAKKKFTDIIIYSDFETYPVDDFNVAINNTKATIHPIFVLNNWYDDQNCKNVFEKSKENFPNLFQKNNYLLVK